MIREEHLRQIEDLLGKARDLANSCGLSSDELTEMLRLICEDD